MTTLSQKLNKLLVDRAELDLSLSRNLQKSILQEAIQGKLVAQDPTDEPASVLIERIREEKKRLLKEGKLKKKDITDSVIYKGEDNKYYEQIGGETIDITEDIPFDLPSTWSWVRFGQYIKRYSNQTQFIIITHRRGTMEIADRLYGVTMPQKGISKVLTMDVNDVGKDNILKDDGPKQ